MENLRMSMRDSGIGRGIGRLCPHLGIGFARSIDRVKLLAHGTGILPQLITCERDIVFVTFWFDHAEAARNCRTESGQLVVSGVALTLVCATV
jgi:hypothetical protein